MSRHLQFSVNRRRAEHARIDDDTQYLEYLEAIADVGADIELFDPAPHSRDLARFQTWMSELDLTIGAVHGPHLQRVLDGPDPGAFLRSYVRAEHLASTIDRIPDRSISPAVSTHHPPRLWPDDDRDIDTARRAFLSTYADAMPTLEPDRADLPDAYDGSLITATVALENVAPKTDHQYLLVTPEDVRVLRRTARELGVEDRLAFTCDVGHAGDPAAVLEAMESVVNVHLHSTIATTDPAADELCSRFGFTDRRQLGEFDRPNVAHHLPPYLGDLDLPATFDTLDDHEYDGPITIELARGYRRPSVVYDTADVLAPSL